QRMRDRLAEQTGPLVLAALVVASHESRVTGVRADDGVARDSRLATRDSLEISPEARVRDGYAVRASDLGALAQCPSKSEQHCHAMIARAVGVAKMQPRRLYAPAVFRCRNVAAKRGQSVRGHGQTV